jgi:hypothetical protein
MDHEARHRPKVVFLLSAAYLAMSVCDMPADKFGNKAMPRPMTQGSLTQLTGPAKGWAN